MTTSFIEALKHRRTYYALKKEPLSSDEQIRELVEQAVQHVPSSFNSQSARVVILLGPQHDRLWNLTKTELQKIVPPENFAPTEEKINSAFLSGYGTILYFEDMQVVEGLQQQFPTYRDNFPLWSLQSSGMLQLAIWTALELQGWGASLQHYNPVIDDAVKAAWEIPPSWKLIAQMPFGKPAAEPGAKEFQPVSERVKLFK